MPSLKERAQDTFTVDLRSLAVFRIGLGFSILVDLADRARFLTFLYTDQGGYPGDVMLALKGPLAFLSLHYWAGSDPVLQASLFVLTALAALALAAGYRTRLACLACAYLVLSLQLRNSFVSTGGDLMLRLLLFWGFWLPLGARFSLDQRSGRVPPSADRLLSGAGAALLLQVAMMYVVTGFAKSGPLWASGDAVSYALHAPEYATSFGEHWLRHPSLLRAITHATLWMERFGWLLAFSPIANATCRMLAITTFVGFHLGLATCLSIGLFPLFSIVGWMAFIPTRVWDRAGSEAPSTATPRGMLSRTVDVAAIAVMTFFAWTVTHQFELGVPYPTPFRRVAELLPIRAGWSMFAPDPPRTSVDIGLRIHPRIGSDVRIPAATAQRANMFMWRMATTSDVPDIERTFASARLAISHYFCREWNQSEPNRQAATVRLEADMRGLDASAGGQRRWIGPDVACDEGTSDSTRIE